MVVRKPTFMLALTPMNMRMTVTGRKAYAVMLYIAQRSQPDADGAFSAPVSSILRGFGSASRSVKRLHDYIAQMVQSVVVWRSLAQGDGITSNGTVVAHPDEPLLRSPDAVDMDGPEETRTFSLLAECRVFKRQGDAWLSWYYPPSIKEMLLDPKRFSQINLGELAALSTYTAVALYEIASRYRRVPGGKTTRKSTEFWTQVLRDGGGTKAREWRKFKNEFVAPAIQEINERTMLRVTLIEHRANGTVCEVQFGVEEAVAQRVPVRGAEAADGSVVERASELGIPEGKLDAWTRSYGDAEVAIAVEILARSAAGSNGPARVKRVAFVDSVLKNRQAEGKAAPKKPKECLADVELDGRSEVLMEAPGLDGAAMLAEQQAADQMASRRAAVRCFFAELSEEARLEVLSEIAATAALPSQLRERALRGEWQSPLILAHVYKRVGPVLLGAEWEKPHAANDGAECRAVTHFGDSQHRHGAAAASR